MTIDLDRYESTVIERTENSTVSYCSAISINMKSMCPIVAVVVLLPAVGFAMALPIGPITSAPKLSSRNGLPILGRDESCPQLFSLIVPSRIHMSGTDKRADFSFYSQNQEREVKVDGVETPSNPARDLRQPDVACETFEEEKKIYEDLTYPPRGLRKPGIRGWYKGKPGTWQSDDVVELGHDPGLGYAPLVRVTDEGVHNHQS